MKKEEYILHVSALVVAQLAHRAASGSGFSSDLSFWDEPSDLAKMALRIGYAMASEASKEGLWR